MNEGWCQKEGAAFLGVYPHRCEVGLPAPGRRGRRAQSQAHAGSSPVPDHGPRVEGTRVARAGAHQEWLRCQLPYVKARCIRLLSGAVGQELWFEDTYRQFQLFKYPRI